jgi:enoyl-CoA hydratase
MPVQSSIVDNVYVLTLDRPKVLNAINTEMADALSRHLDVAERDNCDAVVLTGSGRAFCAGTDLRESVGDIEQKLIRMHNIIKRLVEFPKICVAAINGVALGGGLELALACVFRVSHLDAQLGLPEIKLSLMPSYGGTQLLPRLIGSARALEMMLLGEPISAGKAQAIGLITAIAPDPVRAAIDLARRVATRGSLAQQLIRKAVNEGGHHDLDSALNLERGFVMAVGKSLEAQNALAAFGAHTKSGPQ